MPHEMKGFRGFKSFNDRKREEDNDKHIKAAIEAKKRIISMTPVEVGKLQAYAYAKSLYLSGLTREARS